MRWQEIVVIPETEEDVTCDCCGQPARSVEGRLVHREEPIGRFTVRWRPGVPEHPARHTLYLGDWNRKGGMDDGPAVAAADVPAVLLYTPVVQPKEFDAAVAASQPELPEGASVPEIGDQVDVAVRFTATSFDQTLLG